MDPVQFWGSYVLKTWNFVEFLSVSVKIKGGFFSLLQWIVY